MKFIKEHKKFYILTASFLCVLMILLGFFFKTKATFAENIVDFFVTPFVKINFTISKFFTDKIEFFSNINRIEVENKTMTKEIAELREENKKLQNVETEYKKLLKLLDMKEKYPDYEKVGAYVIDKSIGNWYSTFNIDVGTNNGIKENMVVISTGGLVGRILTARATSSTVISIIDDTSVAAASGLRSNALGMVRGDIGLVMDGLCLMENIDYEADIVEGEEVVTSNLSNIYPPGISMGVVTKIKTDAKGLTKSAEIKPFVDFKNLDTVLVIKQTFEKTDDITNTEVQ